MGRLSTTECTYLPIYLWFVFACPRVCSVRHNRAPAQVRSPVEAPAGASDRGRGGAWGAGSAAPPPGRRSPFGGRGDVSPFHGGGCPRGPQAGGGSGGRGEGGLRRGSPPPFFRGVACGPRPSPPSLPAHSCRVYLFGRGRWAAPGAGRGLVPLVPLAPAAAGGRPGGPCPGGAAIDGGGRILLLPPPILRASDRRAGPHPRAPCSPRCRGLTTWCRSAGGGLGGEGRQVLGVAARVSG